MGSRGLYPPPRRRTRLSVPAVGYRGDMDLIRAFSAIPQRGRDDAGISVIGIVLALAAIGLILVAAVIAFVIPN